MEQIKIDTKYINLGQLTSNLKTEDKKYALLSRRFQAVYWILIPIYLLAMVGHIVEKNPLRDIIGSLCFLLSMLTFALLFRHYYKEYNNVDYSEPTLLMLKKAALRYKPFQLKTLWALVAVLLIDASLTLNSSLEFDFYKTQIYFLGAVAIAFSIGLVVWHIRYKPIRDKALQLIDEIINE